MGIIDKFLGPPLPRRPGQLAGTTPDCKNCQVRAAWKTLKASLIFKGNQDEMLTYLANLEEQYGFEIK